MFLAFWQFDERSNHLQTAFTFVLSNGSSDCLPVRMQSHIGSICLVFLHWAFLNGSLNCLPVRMQSPIGSISFLFLHCAFSNGSSDRLPETKHSRGEKDLALVWSSHLDNVMRDQNVYNQCTASYISWTESTFNQPHSDKWIHMFMNFLKHLNIEFKCNIFSSRPLSI